MRLLLTLLAVAVSATQVRAQPWSPQSTSYAYAPIARCSDPTTARVHANEASYAICTDQMALFKAAVEKARGENRLLIVEFGATWCPMCRSLKRQWPTSALLGHRDQRHDFAATFNLVAIGLSTLQAGRLVNVPSGQAVLEHVLAATKGVQQKSVPFLAVIDPEDQRRTVARNLDDFELASEGVLDAARVRLFLTHAHDHIRLGGRAPVEPGWLRKKISRLWSRLLGG